MTGAAVVHSDLRHSAEAGVALGSEIRAKLGGHSPDALVVFASPQHDFPALLHAVHDSCEPEILVGCSSAGEFTSHRQGEGLVSAVALRSSEMRFSAGLGRGLRQDRQEAAEAVVRSFQRNENAYRYRSALVLTDALAGHADDLVERLTLLTGGAYSFFGGGAGDDGLFNKTHVFLGTEVVTDAVVALEILSEKPIGIGVRHGWTPMSKPLRVTESVGMQIISLNAAPAVEAFREHAFSTDQRFEEAHPMPFFLHNVLGIDTGSGHKLRVPLGVAPDGSVACAAEVPSGSLACVMHATVASAADAAAQATKDALAQVQHHTPKVAFFFDCVATRLRLGKEFGVEMRAIADALGGVEFVGFNSYGQVARREGQFNGFHNCTAVVCVISE